MPSAVVSAVTPRFLSRLGRRGRRQPAWAEPVANAQSVWRFGLNTKLARTKAGLTVEEVAKRANLDEEDLRLMEAGRLGPPLVSFMLPLASAIDVPLSSLLDGVEAPLPVSPQMAKVLKAMAESSRSEEWFGLELLEATGLSSGVLYPALATLEHGALVLSRFEEEDERIARLAEEADRPDGRPGRDDDEELARRRLYHLTPLGEEIARFIPSSV